MKLFIKLINPLILWCYGWKRHRVDWGSPRWEDPDGTGWWTEEDAIMICEKRIK